MKTKLLISLGLILLFIYLIPQADAATYYVDYQSGSDSNNGLSTTTPWKRCPGMIGFSGSYSHQAGDRFIFKGGVTWPASVFYSTSPLQAFTIGFSGTLGNVDEYTTDQTWYSGASYSPPVWDGGGAVINNAGMLESTGTRYVKINGIKFQNIGDGTDAKNGRAIYLLDVSDWEISNIAIDANGKHGIVAAWGASGKSNFKVHHSNFTRLTNIIEMAIDYDVTGIEIYNNHFYDCGPLHTLADHGDGIHVWRTGTAKADGIKIHNNLFDGDMLSGYGATALIYLESSGKNAEIYNNLITFNNTMQPNLAYWYFSPAVVDVVGCDSCKIYENTIDGTNYAPVGLERGFKTCIYSVNENDGIAESIEIKNNILSGCKWAIMCGNKNLCNWTSDNNLFYVRSDGYIGADETIYFSTLSNWQGFLGGCPYSDNDCNSLSANPLFISSSNKRLQSSSPAKDAGINLGYLYSTDLDGIPRPQGSAWDIGAYEYVQSTQTCSQLGGSCCPPGQVCSAGSFTSSSDCSYCCAGTCRTPSCPDSFCDPGETCPADNCCSGSTYNPSTQKCCSGSLYTGNCCSDSDCSSPKTCNNFVCSIPPQLCDNLVLLMHFDNQAQYGENSTHIYDFSRNGNNGTAQYNAFISTTGGKFSGASQFDGDGDMVLVPNKPSLNFGSNVQFAISAWVKTNGTDTQQVLLSKRAGAGYQIWLDSNPRFRIDEGATPYDTYFTYPFDNSWHHIVAMRNSSHASVWVDGIIRASTADSTLADLTDQINLTIGNEQGWAPSTITGSIDELAIWNRSLSSQEIQSLYSSSSPIYCQTCIHKSDNNPCDGKVCRIELFTFIDRWKYNNQDVNLRELIDAIGLYNKNKGC